MELKLRTNFERHLDGRLLIVPYGIETYCGIRFNAQQVLLIVPYGIETNQPYTADCYGILLIVPYGIETW